jgi:hypothetical protein
MDASTSGFETRGALACKGGLLAAAPSASSQQSSRLAEGPSPDAAAACCASALLAAAPLTPPPPGAEAEEAPQCEVCADAPLEVRLTACGHSTCTACVGRLLARAQDTVRSRARHALRGRSARHAARRPALGWSVEVPRFGKRALGPCAAGAAPGGVSAPRAAQ